MTPPRARAPAPDRQATPQASGLPGHGHTATTTTPPPLGGVRVNAALGVNRVALCYRPYAPDTDNVNSLTVAVPVSSETLSGRRASARPRAPRAAGRPPPPPPPLPPAALAAAVVNGIAGPARRGARVPDGRIRSRLHAIAKTTGFGLRCVGTSR